MKSGVTDPKSATLIIGRFAQIPITATTTTPIIASGIVVNPLPLITFLRNLNPTIEPTPIAIMPI